MHRSASLADIKAAYKRFALKLHPDVTGGHGVGLLLPPLSAHHLPSHFLRHMKLAKSLHFFSRRDSPCGCGREQEKTEVFKQLTEAYNVLSNEDRRKSYDSSLGVQKARNLTK